MLGYRPMTPSWMRTRLIAYESACVSQEFSSASMRRGSHDSTLPSQRSTVTGKRQCYSTHDTRKAVDEDMPPVTQITHKQVYEEPITRSHAKLLQKEVNSLLAEINFNIHENIILPKCSTLVVLRYTHKDEDASLRGDELQQSDHEDRTNKPSRLTLTVRTIKRSSHNSLIPQPLEVNKYLLESLSSPLSNPTNGSSFGLPSRE